ncbi:1-phosphatidylinositol 4-kinase ASCRUDRAFT_33370 [Ascoidea rubescens DSM 1968]|uniref:1-phosphatidylinositol 4-kinase n=1 Tax=Ascoidea rubescens DSM 1968 TaxID=1344418 RepID=A0A1D2VJF3_9ASCO|nr:hypothetical protein ASCRUDRAFT_33370 [Ascoidea rubescens DSM 1968]ODV61741.1 hypothetical protein ASCRUDRAFT_33370 [Ascoidea rubescens DSM 1968]
MDQSSGNAMLLRLINSQHFSLFLCISYLERYASNIGIFSYLCQRIRSYKYDEIQFFVPQLCQILVTVETQSMALEDLLLDLSSQHPHFTLLAFWQLQAHLHDLSQDPESFGFQITRKMLNSLQYVIYNATPPPSNQFRENIAPALILSSAIAGAIALPQLASHIGPLAKSQGRKQKTYVFQIAKNFSDELVKNLTLKNTKKNSYLSVSSSKSQLNLNSTSTSNSFTNSSNPFKNHVQNHIQNHNNNLNYDHNQKSLNSPVKLHSFDNINNANHLNTQINFDTIQPSSINLKNMNDQFKKPIPDTPPTFDNFDLIDKYPNSLFNNNTDGGALKNKNLYNNYNNKNKPPSRAQTLSRSSLLLNCRKRDNKSSNSRHHGSNIRNISPTLMSTTTKIKLLKSNYYRCETQFAIALQQISLRLSQVPKEARLASLKAELSLLNKDLPAEVDIPTLFPPNKKGKLHKIVRITPNEAAVLNSAERVPFLLLIEYLNNDLDFDSSSSTNLQLLREKPDRTYIFDLGIQTTNLNSPKSTGFNDNDNYNDNDNDNNDNIDHNDTHLHINEKEGDIDEADLADLSVIKITDNEIQNERLRKELFVANTQDVPILDSPPINNTQNSYSKLVNGRNPNMTNDDLATHMRIAAVMLTQLDNPSNTLPSDQSAAIKAKIIASMQSFQDNFGLNDYMIRGERGERKLENDLKLGGVSNKNSTSYLGEDWDTKKERIRKESPYGHFEDWDLCSVIAKNGDDLRQEAFACQLIQAIADILKEANGKVWVKKMRILITSANTGLVETITNAISIHSIKKSLTGILIENGENPKGTVPPLTEHFKRVFGDENSLRYNRAQDNFACSLAPYSLICYLLQIKDRHNGNIMLDNEGHIIHIDFGFLLSNSPGSVGFEAAPFKLTQEYVDILGGVDGEYFHKFSRLMKESFKIIRKHAESVITMVELMQKESSLPCFKAGDQTGIQLRQRFQLHLTDSECDKFVENYLIQKSLGSIYTRLYDQFQLITQGIYS